MKRFEKELEDIENELKYFSLLIVSLVVMFMLATIIIHLIYN